MSRLLIKNIPTYLDTTRLRQHFEQKGAPSGTITDVKVAQKNNGTARRFAFVGYKTDEEAAAAKEWFDKSFIGSARINVVVVDGAKDAPTPRPNKRQRTGPSPEERLAESKESKKAAKKSKKDVDDHKSKPNDPSRPSHLDEYLSLTRSKKGPVWANDAVPLASNAAVPLPSSPSAEDQTEGDDEMNVDEEAEDQTEEISDLEWMRRRMGQAAQTEAEADSSKPQTVATISPSLTPVDEKDQDLKDETPEAKGPQDEATQTILQTARLFLRNLAYSCTEDELLELFSPFGDVKQAHIPLDPVSGQPKGMAYVTFKAPSAAVTAYGRLDKTSFQGRLLHILPAVDRRGNFVVEDAAQGGGKKNVKGEREASRKAVSGKDFNWGLLYMNSDAVASSIADRMNISKADLLNSESSDNAAVKLALAETHIIQETRVYLESQGVDLESFSSPSSSSAPSSSSSRPRSRSPTIILVKNIPYGTTIDKITELFEPHGKLRRAIVPPAGTMAVVEFENPGEAAAAFRAVAYRRMGNSIVYLEKGPTGMFKADAPTLAMSSSSSGAAATSASKLPGMESVATVKIAEQQLSSSSPSAANKGEEVEPSLSAGSTLYVKNLSFTTTTERLTQVFSHLASFSFARVQTKPDPNRPSGPRLSMGYGFIGFKDKEGATNALKGIQGYNLDGHALHVKFAGRGTENDAKEGEKDKGKKSETTTKMIVKNVPFEATKKDIRQLFGAHGQLKSVRLPQKFGARSRGFAFLDFTSRREAENAYATLRYTHLLGRHLVLEWAQDEEQDIDVLRMKAGVGYGDGKAVPGRKRKIVMPGGEEVAEGGEEEAG